MPLIVLIMKRLSTYGAVLAVMLSSGAAFARPPENPLDLARQIAALTAGGFYDPAPPVPASDIVQRDPRPR